MGKLTAVALDDEVHASDRPFGKEGCERCDPSAERHRKPSPDCGARGTAVAIAWHVNEYGDEALEWIEARQYANARTLAEFKDDQGKAIE